MPTILITGANRGIGLEMTKQYLQDRWHVIACCRSPDKADELLKLERVHKGKLQLCQLDLKQANDIASLPSRLQNQSIDVLINNAGILRDREENFKNVTPQFTQAWLETFQVNTIAAALMIHSLNKLISASEQKIIVNISSHLGSIHLASDLDYLLYGSSKAALNYVSKCMAEELKSQGITVVSLHPGWVKTDMGGEEADITATASVNGLRKVINNLTLQQAGCFYDYQGKIIPF